MRRKPTPEDLRADGLELTAAEQLLRDAARDPGHPSAALAAADAIFQHAIRALKDVPEGQRCDDEWRAATSAFVAVDQIAKAEIERIVADLALIEMTTLKVIYVHFLHGPPADCSDMIEAARRRCHRFRGSRKAEAA